MKTNEIQHPFKISNKDHFIVGTSELDYFLNTPRRITGVVILWCVKGSAKITTDITTYNLGVNDEYIMMFNKIVTISETTPDFEVRFCALSIETFRGITHQLEVPFIGFLYNRPPSNITEDKNQQAIQSFFEQIERVYNNTTHLHRYKMMYNLVQNHILDIYNTSHPLFVKSESEASDQKHVIFKSFMTLLQQHYKEERNVSFYAEKLCVSSRYLHAITASLTKNPPKTIIDEFITLEIKILLRSSSLSIQEIAHKLNFPDQSSMGRFFKKQTGKSPVEFRNKP